MQAFPRRRHPCPPMAIKPPPLPEDPPGTSVDSRFCVKTVRTSTAVQVGRDSKARPRKASSGRFSPRRSTAHTMRRWTAPVDELQPRTRSYLTSSWSTGVVVGPEVLEIGFGSSVWWRAAAYWIVDLRRRVRRRQTCTTSRSRAPHSTASATGRRAEGG